MVCGQGASWRAGPGWSARVCRRRLLLGSIGCGWLPCIAVAIATTDNPRAGCTVQSLCPASRRLVGAGCETTYATKRDAITPRLPIGHMCLSRSRPEASISRRGTSSDPTERIDQGDGNYALLTEPPFPQPVGGPAPGCSKVPPGGTSLIQHGGEEFPER
jgi:hypothetical protein